MGSPQHAPWRRAVARAERQWGLLRRSDFAPLEIHGRLVRSWVLGDRLHQVHPGVFAVGHTVLPRSTQFLAATWWCGGDGALAGESACAFYGWIAEDRDHPPPIVLTSTSRKRPPAGLELRWTRRLPREDVLTFERLLRVTDDARTLIDRADEVSYRALRLLADQLRDLPVDALQRKHALLPGRRGWKRTELLIHSEDARSKSEHERRFGTYARHHGVRLPDGRNEWVGGCKVDCVYYAERLAVELDSRAHHQRRREMLVDRARDRKYRRAGYKPIRIMWEELELDDRRVADELHELLDGGGCVL